MRLGAETLSGMPPAYVRRCSINMRRNSRPRWSTISAIAARRCCSRRCCRRAPPPRKPAFFRRAIDLGCGTGLAAARLRREVDHFIGIDLSPRMIERARATGLYAELEVADMVQGLRGRPDASADLILAADAMVYVADLAPLLARGRARAGAGRPARVHASKPMAARASCSARGCAMPTARPMCAHAVEAAGLDARAAGSLRPATRTMRRCPAWSWSRRKRESRLCRCAQCSMRRDRAALRRAAIA